MGVRLFERTTGKVMLTPSGNVFLEEVYDIFERVEMAVTVAQDAASGSIGKLSIAGIGALSSAFLPPALSKYRELYPLIEVTLEEVHESDQWEALRSGKIQVGFFFYKGTLLPSDFETMELAKMDVLVALNKDHPLAKDSSVSLRDLMEDSVAAVGKKDTESMHAKAIKNIFAKRGIKHRHIRRVGGYDALLALIAGGHCVSLLLKADFSVYSDKIAYRPIHEQGDDLYVMLSAIWCRDNRSKALDNFIGVLEEKAVN